MKNAKLSAWLSKQPKIRIANQKKAIPTIFTHMVDNKVIVFDKGIPYIWLDNYYQCILDEDILVIIVNLVDEYSRIELKPTVPKNVYEKLKVDLRLQVDISGEFQRNQFFINTKNGVYDIMKKELLPHDKSKKFDYQLDFNYVKNTNINQAIALVKYLQTSLGSNMESLNFLLEMTGYSLSSLTKARVAFQLIGKGMRGKSVWLNFMENIVDESLRTSLSFSDLGKREYLVKLASMRVNICNDNDSTPMKNESIFKRIVSAEPVCARALYSNMVTFKPTAKLIFGSNHDLTFAHPDDELYDRIHVLLFENDIPKNQLDPSMLEKLLKNKDVIMSLAVDTLCDLVKRNYKFTLPESSKRYTESRRNELHSDNLFFKNQIIADPDGEISSTKLWEGYQKWCEENSLDPIGRNTFLRNVCNFFPGVIKCEIGPKRLQGFKGIRFITSEELNSTENKDKR